MTTEIVPFKQPAYQATTIEVHPEETYRRPQPVPTDAALVGDIVTIVFGTRDAGGQQFVPLSKHFRSDGSKKRCTAPYGVAVHLHVPTATDLGEVQKFASRSPSVALLGVRYPGRPVYRLSDLQFLVKARQLQVGLVDIGFIIDLTGRPKQGALTVRHEHTLPSDWLLIDYDPDESTPERFRCQSAALHLQMLTCAVPGLSSAPRVEAPSATRRILKAGVPLDFHRGHMWVYAPCRTWDDRKAAASLVRAHLKISGHAWTELAVNGRPQVKLPTDLSTWTSAGWVFCGKPSVDEGAELSVENADGLIRVVNERGPAVRLADIAAYDLAALQTAEARLRPGIEIRPSGKGIRHQVDIYDLSHDMTVELDDGTVTTLADVHQHLLQREASGTVAPKQRMQSPLRPDSRSMAAFATLTRNGDLVLADSGLPGESHFIETDPLAGFSPIGTDANSTQPTAPYVMVSPPRLPVLHLSALLGQPPVQWLIKGIVPMRAIVVLYGDSGAGKTFVAIDLMLAVAQGIAWRGRRIRQAGVLYVAGEGGGGLGQRADAYRKYHDVDLSAVPVSAITVGVSLLRGDATKVIEACRELTEQGNSVGLVVLDTLNRTMGGGDENSSADMGLFIAAVSQISQATGATVMIIHHTGKDSTRGARGHSSLRAAVDTELELRVDGDVQLLTVRKSRDGRDGLEFAYRREVVELGVDEDLEWITSCVAVEAALDDAPSRRPRPQGKWQQLVYDVIDAGAQTEADLLAAIEGTPDARGRWRESARRALITLLAGGIVERDGLTLQVKS